MLSLIVLRRQGTDEDTDDGVGEVEHIYVNVKVNAEGLSARRLSLTSQRGGPNQDLTWAVFTGAEIAIGLVMTLWPGALVGLDNGDGNSSNMATAMVTLGAAPTTRSPLLANSERQRRDRATASGVQPGSTATASGAPGDL